MRERYRKSGIGRWTVSLHSAHTQIWGKGFELIWFFCSIHMSILDKWEQIHYRNWGQPDLTLPVAVFVRLQLCTLLQKPMQLQYYAAIARPYAYRCVSIHTQTLYYHCGVRVCVWEGQGRSFEGGQCMHVRDTYQSELDNIGVRLDAERCMCVQLQPSLALTRIWAYGYEICHGSNNVQLKQTLLTK